MNTHKFWIVTQLSAVVCIAICMAIVGLREVAAQEAGPTKLPKTFMLPNPSGSTGRISDYTPEQLERLFQKEINSYEIDLLSADRKLILRKEPVLNWKNPEVLNQGSLFVWMDGTRPAALVSIFSYQSKDDVRRRHEVMSFCSQPLVAKFEGQVVWKPSPADLKGIAIAEEIEVASNAPRRLTQMRSIARDVRGKHTTMKQIIKELRLMPQPLIRYDSAAEGLIDGAIFALSTGTDPEVLVMIEARSVNNVNKWFIVPFRSHYDLLEISYKGNVIWTAECVPELMSTVPMQIPFAMRPFFVFTPPKPMPSPESLK